MKKSTRDRNSLELAIASLAGGVLVTAAAAADAGAIEAPELTGPQPKWNAPNSAVPSLDTVLNPQTKRTLEGVLHAIGVPVPGGSQVSLLADDATPSQFAFEIVTDGNRSSRFVQIVAIEKAPLAMSATHLHNHAEEPVGDLNFSAELGLFTIAQGRRSTLALAVLSTFVLIPHDEASSWTSYRTVSVLGEVADAEAALELIAKAGTAAAVPEASGDTEVEAIALAALAGSDPGNSSGPSYENTGDQQPPFTTDTDCVAPCDGLSLATREACDHWFRSQVEATFAAPIGNSSRGCLGLCLQSDIALAECLESCVAQYAADLAPTMRFTLQFLGACHDQADAEQCQCQEIWCGTPC